DPRHPDRMGRHYGSIRAEIADPDHRDGAGALLDDDAHNRKVGRLRARREDDDSMAHLYGEETMTERWDDFERVPRRRSGMNVGRTERIASGIAGAALLVVG